MNVTENCPFITIEADAYASDFELRDPVVLTVHELEQGCISYNDRTKFDEVKDDSQSFSVPHCLICNKVIKVKSFEPKTYIFKEITKSFGSNFSDVLSNIVGHYLIPEKIHSEIVCQKCYTLVNEIDALELQIKKRKAAIIHCFNSTFALYASSMTVNSSKLFHSISEQGSSNCNLGFTNKFDVKDYVTPQEPKESDKYKKKRRRRKLVRNRTTTPCVCPFCGYCASQAHTMECHINNMHTKEVKYPCKICSEVFYVKPAMMEHYKRHHTNEADWPFKCDICNKKFFKGCEKKRHIKLVHLNVRKHLCFVCGKGFKMSSHLKVHLLGHSDERPYDCDLCGKNFRRCSDAIKHCKRMHGLDITHKYRVYRLKPSDKLVEIS